jgi:hypothetical protein
MYIAKLYYKDLPDKPKCVPQNWFFEYFRDLYALEETDTVDLSSYNNGSQYTYAELGDAVLASCASDNLLRNLDLMIVCFWSYEFDPVHACGAYFCERYKIKGKVFDVCEQGMLSPIIALQIIESYFKQGEASNAVLVCFDQTAIPVGEKFSGILPTKTSSLAMYIEHEKSNNSQFEILDSTIVHRSACNFSSNHSMNCVELFTPLIEGRINKANGDDFTLMVSDVESEYCGLMKGKICR